ncbi:hypothetical protein KEM44_23145 [Sinorhizobium meliloti]|uniref:hypothetical protein n=1 Tax=Rhizobium meliloti TaxID=382 RepID=UPI000B5A9EDD|nr:hypothetical protein [Sinorhizobium meliloti]ASJ59363.1 hypothetical protein SMB554_09240 [Sinorhizobium meliloti]MCK3783097.1 hypothetical protein [Sinorhizobium meliloti]MCK3788273.1 hypothetical protein [Sinorhizobium meliloti]MCK3794450.1 hypothetical protein [Sinorhizobium meliloti]UTG96504.1 hypothetical protein KEM44_23145 [Sinorhizobium meliloti]
MSEVQLDRLLQGFGYTIAGLVVVTCAFFLIVYRKDPLKLALILSLNIVTFALGLWAAKDWAVNLAIKVGALQATATTVEKIGEPFVYVSVFLFMTFIAAKSLEYIYNDRRDVRANELEKQKLSAK